MVKEKKLCLKCCGTGTYIDPNGRTAGDCPVCKPYPHELRPDATNGLREEIALDLNRYYYNRTALQEADAIISLLSTHIDQIAREKGYVKLDKDQTLPDFVSKDNVGNALETLVWDIMKEAGWKKVK